MSIATQGLRFCIFVITAVLFVLWASPLNAQSQNSDCSYLVLHHSYSQEFDGYLNLPVYFGSPDVPAGIVPNAGTGFLTFLPHGKVTGKTTLAIGLLGLAQDIVFVTPSNYSLAWDTSQTPALCTGTLALYAANEPPFNFQLLVTHDGQQIQMIHTDTGLIVSVTGYLVETAGCSNSMLKGKYSYNAQGWALNPPGGPASFPSDQLLSGHFPLAFNGELEFLPHESPSSAVFPESPAGSGSVEFRDTVSANGIIHTRHGEGWYKINPDCSGMMAWREADDSQNPDFHLEMVVGKGGETVYVANVDTVPGGFTPLFVLGATLSRSDRDADSRAETKPE